MTWTDLIMCTALEEEKKKEKVADKLPLGRGSEKKKRKEKKASLPPRRSGKKINIS